MSQKTQNISTEVLGTGAQCLPVV